MGKGLWIALGALGVFILVVLMVAASFITARNQLVARDEAIKASWSEIDVQLQRRADLLPNLVETVKGYAKQETTVYGEIAQARSALLNAQGPQAKIAANGRLDSAIGRLLMISENYPQLRSNDQFLRLQDELSGTENRIAVARRRYNSSLQDYNTYLRMFPNNIWAGFSGFQPNNNFIQASEAARVAPKVKF